MSEKQTFEQDLDKSETEELPPEAPPEIISAGKIVATTFGGGKQWEDGNKFSERA